MKYSEPVERDRRLIILTRTVTQPGRPGTRDAGTPELRPLNP